mgnify:CR=1 FL=1
MAERRMFAKTIIDSDAFLDMPLSTQALYFHLSMRADDDGFVNNPRKIQRVLGCQDDDLKLLIAKKFLIPFDSGVVVIKHWKLHNYIQKDRYKPTVYTEEMKMLETKDNHGYTMAENEPFEAMDTGCIQDGYTLETQVRLGKDSIDKDNKDIGEEISEKPNKADIYEDVPIDLLEPIKEFTQFRKEIKKPMTKRAITLLLGKLNDMTGGDVSECEKILNQSIMNGWSSVYEIKEKKEKSFLDIEF